MIERIGPLPCKLKKIPENSLVALSCTPISKEIINTFTFGVQTPALVVSIVRNVYISSTCVKPNEYTRPHVSNCSAECSSNQLQKHLPGSL